MVKPYFSRKNLIVIALVFFYTLMIIFCGLCLDGAHEIFKKSNIIRIFANGLGFESIVAGVGGLVTLLLVALYIFIFAICFIYERRYAKINGKKIFSFKMICIYLITLAICIFLSFGVGMIIQANVGESVRALFNYISQAVIIGSMIYAVLFGILAFSTMLIINFLFVDKPFKFWNKHEQAQVEEEIGRIETDVTSSFDINPELQMAAGLAPASQSQDNNIDLSNIKKVEELDDREKVFPALSNMDIQYEGYAIEHFNTDDVSLKQLCEGFRNYLANVENLYFDEDTIRVFISAFGTSHFMILEGLSGTGKSSLPRYFAKYVNANLLFLPVQTTWRDKTSILGYFNDFSKTYTETDFLLHLYHANYNPDQIHIFVLDEMNISRVEYYFADLLSVLEYPIPDWKLRLMQIPHGFIPPAKLDDGFIQIPANSFFVGTANKDDSTFVITDKVYDRAITIDFNYRNKAFKSDVDVKTINLSYSKLNSLLTDALNVIDNQMTDDDYKKFETITNFIYEEFDVTFGNRILNQIETLVPIFIACGGTKESIIDFLLVRKVLTKLEGRFEEFVKPALKQLSKLIAKTYGDNKFERSQKAINNMIRRL